MKLHDSTGYAYLDIFSQHWSMAMYAGGTTNKRLPLFISSLNLLI